MAGFKIMIVEQADTALKHKLQRSNPFKNKRCQRTDCMVCRNEGKGDCTVSGVMYEIACKECKYKYVGETARSAYSRGKEHQKSIERREELSSYVEACHGQTRISTKLYNERNWHFSG